MKQVYMILFLCISLISFAQLVPPVELQTYYSDVDFSQTQMDLFNDLAVETASKHTNFLTYTPGIWEAAKITDEDPVNTLNVLLIYGYNDADGNHVTDRSRSKLLNGGDNGTDWNREHTFPNSLGNPNLDSNGSDNVPYADAHNLRPSDVQMNQNRGNRKFGEGSGNAATAGANWYPGDEWKGDAARIIMYMYLRYGTQCFPSFATTGSSNTIDPNMINLLLEWNAEDPVSTIEDSRNNYHANTSNTYAQGNRNPFIDNPFLATIIWGGTQATNRWGDNPPADVEAPTIPTNLIASNETATTVDLNWTASTDNIGVAAYNVYVDNAYYMSTNSSATSITLLSLSSETTYEFSVLAADLANNTSGFSNSVTAITLAANTSGDDCVFETFENMSANSSSYSDRTWTGDDNSNQPWQAKRARTDQTLNNRAIVIDVRGSSDGSITSPTIAGGIGSLTASTRSAFSGGTGTLDVFVNNILVGTLPYNDTAQTTTISNIDISGAVQIEISENTSGGDRVFIDDLSWTCYSTTCVFETFESMPANSSSYSDRTWTGDTNSSEPWLAKRARTDQTLNNRAIVIDVRGSSDGSITSPTSAGGIGSLTASTLRAFSGGTGSLDVFVNTTLVGTLPYNDTVQTTTISNIDISGDVQIEISENTSGGDRVFIDDLSWTCYSTLSINDKIITPLKMFPNPAKDKINISLAENNEIKIEIYNLLGKRILIREINKYASIDVSSLKSGLYLVRFTENEKMITKKLVISN
jgi:endonuclease I